jgi:DNA-binding transcriptional LysR family regulator
MNIEALSLDQLRAVLAVVEAGSFSAAARRFGRAQSAVSYAIAQAEQQLGVELFDRSGQKPVLTASGRTLIHDIRAIVARADDLQARARAVSEGVEAELTLVIDTICAPAALARVLTAFRSAFPTVPVRVHVDTLGMVIERVLSQRGSLGVVATMLDLPDGLTRYALPPTRMYAVAAPNHPLAATGDADSLELMQSAVQIVLSDRSRRTEGRDYAVFSPNTWRVDDLLVKYELIRAGVGWGCMPAWMVDADLAAGVLGFVRAPSLPDIDDMVTQAFHDAGHKPGPALAWVIERLRVEGLNA